MTRLPRKRDRGFTLVEAIVVIVLTSILAGIMVLFIRNPVQSYVDSAGRAELTDVAEIALRRMARELHGAVPNSVRFTTSGSTSFLEFIPSRAGGRYLSEDDGADTTQQPHPALSFTDPNSLQFEVIGPMPQAPYAMVKNDIIIISNFGTGFTDGDAYANNANNRATVDQVGSNKVITLVSNPFATHVSPSPSKRFIVAGTPVTFACVNDPNGKGVLRRYWGYGFMATQGDPSANAQMALMADNVVGCNFSVQATANRQTALVSLAIALSRAKPGAANGLETVTLAQQIHVDNTP
jgi:MSHA biogenesis protein MshO